MGEQLESMSRRDGLQTPAVFVAPRYSVHGAGWPRSL